MKKIKSKRCKAREWYIACDRYDDVVFGRPRKMHLERDIEQLFFKPQIIKVREILPRAKE